MRCPPNALRKTRRLVTGSLPSIARPMRAPQPRSWTRREFRGLSEAVLRRRLGIPAQDAARVLGELIERGEVEALGDGAPASAGGRVLLAPSSLRAVQDRITSLLSAWETENRLRAGMPVEQLREQTGVPAVVADGALARLASAGALELTRHTVGTVGRQVQLRDAERRALDRLAGLLDEGGFTPPTLGEAAEELGVPPELVDALRRLLLREGRAVDVSPDLYFDAGRLAALRRAVAERAAVNPEIDVGWFKQNFGLSRKHAIPLLEWLDRERVTVRVGNLRKIRTGAAPGVAPA